ncbi:MAG: hypothetical protein JW726_02655 [Anaerolineales bacterium]|nr:hypothetical protein [Anaerolineales bacterium]
MLQKLNLEDDAPWKQRYRAASVGSVQIAPACPTRAILNDTRSGSLQYYAWDIPGNSLRALTDTPGGFTLQVEIPTLSFRQVGAKITQHVFLTQKGGTYVQGEYEHHSLCFRADLAALPWLSVPRPLT